MNGPYYNNSLERIEAQIRDLETMRAQLQRTPAINQTFQLAPSHTGVRVVQDKKDVEKELVFQDCAFFNKEMDTLWVKNAKGEIKTYKIEEVIPRDEKDDIIDDLKKQLDELRKEKENAKSNINSVPEPSKD